jgi:hypothetical protein
LCELNLEIFYQKTVAKDRFLTYIYKGRIVDYNLLLPGERKGVKRRLGDLGEEVCGTGLKSKGWGKERKRGNSLSLLGRMEGRKS